MMLDRHPDDLMSVCHHHIAIRMIPQKMRMVEVMSRKTLLMLRNLWYLTESFIDHTMMSLLLLLRTLTRAAWLIQCIL